MQENQEQEKGKTTAKVNALSYIRDIFTMGALVACVVVIVTQDSRLTLVRYSDEQRTQAKTEFKQILDAELEYHKAESEHRRAQDEKSNALLAAILLQLQPKPAPQPVKKRKTKIKATGELYTTDNAPKFGGAL